MKFAVSYFFMHAARANLFKTIAKPQILEGSANNGAEQPREPPKPDVAMANASEAITKQEPQGLARTSNLAMASLAKTIARPDLSDQLRNISVEQPIGRTRDPDVEISSASKTFTGPDPLGRAETDLVVGNVSKNFARQTFHDFPANDNTGQPFRQVPRGRARVPVLTGLDNKIDDNYMKGSIWPKPQLEDREDLYYFVDSLNFEFTTRSNGSFLRFLESAFQRYRKITFPKKENEEMPYGVVLNNLDVVIQNDFIELDVNMDEHCKYIAGR